MPDPNSKIEQRDTISSPSPYALQAVQRFVDEVWGKKNEPGSADKIPCPGPAKGPDARLQVKAAEAPAQVPKPGLAGPGVPLRPGKESSNPSESRQKIADSIAKETREVKLPKLTPVQQARIESLIKRLDSDKYIEREIAEGKLKKDYGTAALPQMYAALYGAIPPMDAEGRKRLGHLCGVLTSSKLSTNLDNVLTPVKGPEAFKKRLDAVEEFVNDPAWRIKDIKHMLRMSADAVIELTPKQMAEVRTNARLDNTKLKDAVTGRVPFDASLLKDVSDGRLHLEAKQVLQLNADSKKMLQLTPSQISKIRSGEIKLSNHEIKDGLCGKLNLADVYKSISDKEITVTEKQRESILDGKVGLTEERRASLLREVQHLQRIKSISAELHHDLAGSLLYEQRRLGKSDTNPADPTGTKRQQLMDGAKTLILTGLERDPQARRNFVLQMIADFYLDKDTNFMKSCGKHGITAEAVKKMRDQLQSINKITLQ